MFPMCYLVILARYVARRLRHKTLCLKNHWMKNYGKDYICWWRHLFYRGRVCPSVSEVDSSTSILPTWILDINCSYSKFFFIWLGGWPIPGRNQFFFAAWKWRGGNCSNGNLLFIGSKEINMYLVLKLVEPTRVDPALHICLATLRIQIYEEKTRMTKMMKTIICLWE